MILSAAQHHLIDCHLCPFHCGTARATGAGVCRVGPTSHIASEMLHLGEEELLRPAHAIFFSGCTARCTFCAAARFAFRPRYGVAITADQLAERIVLRQTQGARAVCFIGGDPVPHIPFLLATMAALGTRKRAPVVLNSNFYLTEAALELLTGVVDIYLPDLKFGPTLGASSCGEQLGGMPDYWPIVTACIDHVRRAGAQTIVRHLLLPGHFECCTRPILQWLAERPDLQVSLLTQYLAPAHARGQVARPLADAEIRAARDLAASLDLRLVA